ncbi:MAG: C1 family peptidase [Methanothrix sp.]|nr:C1 family peptidase [Methanothrix sp.]
MTEMEDEPVATDELRMIKERITERRLSWTAGATQLSALTREKRRSRLGLVVPEEEMRRIREMMAQEVAMEERVSLYPASWNWRSVSDKDWTTPIRDQGDCGACVAFATVAMVESCLEILRRRPDLKPDLSEADLFFRGCGNCCSRGWYFDPALNYARRYGIPDEACYPYQGNQTSPCPDRDQRVIKIESWKILSSASQAKEWLCSKGPIMTGMHVYDDLFYYQGGVYRNAAGAYEGDHAICIVGYDDSGGFWICKNSWGKYWGEDGWFRIAYGECGIGRDFAFYAVQFGSDDEIIMPRDGRVVVRFKGKSTDLKDEIWLESPERRQLFQAERALPGEVFYVGSYRSGTRLSFALKTSDGHTYHTDQSLNDDACDHVKKVQLGSSLWELRWEDLYGLGEQDYNDLVMDVEVLSSRTEDLVVPRDGRVSVTLKGRASAFKGELGLSCPVERVLFGAEDQPGESVDLGALRKGDRLSFYLKASDGRIYHTDQVKNPDLLVHVRCLPLGINRWQLRWEESYGLRSRDYRDLVAEVEVIPSRNDDVVLTRDSRVTVRLVGMRTQRSNELWLHSPEEVHILDAVKENVGRSFDLGRYAAGTRLAFALKTDDGYTYYTDSSKIPDFRVHVIKLSLGPTRCQLRWEDGYGLPDRDYNDLVVEVLMRP